MQLYIHKRYLEFLFYFFLQEIKHIFLKARHFFTCNIKGNIYFYLLTEHQVGVTLVNLVTPLVLYLVKHQVT